MIFNPRNLIILLFFFNLININIVMAKSDRDILEQCRYIFNSERKESAHLSERDDLIMEQECTKYMNLMKEALQVGSMLGYVSGLKDAGISEIDIKQKSENIFLGYPSVFDICRYNTEGNNSDPVAKGFNEKEIRRFYNYLKDQPENSRKPISYLYIELMRNIFPLNSEVCRSQNNALDKMSDTRRANPPVSGK